MCFISIHNNCNQHVTEQHQFKYIIKLTIIKIDNTKINDMIKYYIQRTNTIILIVFNVD